MSIHRRKEAEDRFVDVPRMSPRGNGATKTANAKSPRTPRRAKKYFIILALPCRTWHLGDKTFAVPAND
jgi:hypothetical protein